AGDRADLRAADMNAIALARDLVAVELEPDQPVARMLLAPQDSLAADELLIALERHGEADAGLEGIGLIAELSTGEDEPRLDPEHVQRLQPQGHEPHGRTRLEDRVPDSDRVLGMAEDLVAELTRIARARDDDREAVVIADSPDGEVEPLDLGQAGPRRRRPHDPLQQFAALGTLDRDVAQLIR